MILKEINWGMIGCGNVTEKKSGPAFNKVPHSTLVAVMARDIHKAADYAQRHGVPRWYDSVDALLADPEVNTIYIATPPHVHADYAIRAMRAGKAVYVEKPMALNAAECAAMNQVSTETGMPLFVAYYRRALPNFIQIKALVDAKVIGDIRLVHLRIHNPPQAEEVGENPQPRWRVMPEISGGGHFHDLASHQLDYLEYLLGEIKSTQGLARNQAGLYPADDVVVANFEFASGVLGSGTWCFTVNPEQRIDETQIIGSKGKISFAFFNDSPIRVETAEGVVEYPIPYPENVQQPFIESMVQELCGEGKCPSSGVTGARANALMDQIAV
ncbi:Gfo/Idh/MocA family protein [Haliscomenobacter hydrossis]|uniref:Oxidoreductase domain protein n=1 Tax=Haliscomenobacter hydrossis (strain ATCC 27775 / DSM 1100 / LMG 10767 / O) TaxID=760192 RepID=F4L6I7_HALH1|nr:Gfo/Idh/MocA family oxidoreductase [Haliscomenobacter hydrossis]AEE49830.1 oxidoreductase domain protein [Haliscomenobacter hydrossis DSM 1100]